jgi:dTDP-6-deoxy-L-talose 4-dehydrogenase (NAD+)
VKRFVHIGSCFEYGHHDGLISEEASLNPTAIYGATKAAASLLLRERARALGIHLILARPFGMWGPREPAFRLIPQVLAACIARRPLKLTSCEVVRDYTYVEDIADRIVALLRLPDIETGTIVNVGSGQGVVLRDFVLSVARILDGEALMHFGELPHRPTEMASLVADTHRLRNLLGNRHQTSLADGVRRMVVSMRSLPPVPMGDEIASSSC